MTALFCAPPLYPCTLPATHQMGKGFPYRFLVFLIFLVASSRTQRKHHWNACRTLVIKSSLPQPWQCIFQ